MKRYGERGTGKYRERRYSAMYRGRGKQGEQREILRETDNERKRNREIDTQERRDFAVYV